MNKRQIDFHSPHPAPQKKPVAVLIAPVTYKGTLSAMDLQKLLGCSRTKAYSLISETRTRFSTEHRTIPLGFVSEEIFKGQLYGAAPRKENK